MFHPLPLFIGLRYLRGRSGDKFGRFVSYMSTAGIAIGVMSLIAVMAVMNGFEGQLKHRILNVLPQGVIINPHTDPDEKNQFLQWEGVLGMAPFLQTGAVLQSPESLGAGVLFGIDPQANEPVREFLKEGAFDALVPQGYNLVLGQKRAMQLGVSLGDKVRVIISSRTQFTPLGRIPLQRNFKVVGIYETGTDIDDQMFYTHIEDVARLMRLPPSESASVRLFLDDPFDVQRIQIFAESNGYEWSDWRAFRGELFQAVKMEKNMMGLMLSLIILVASFNMISALIMVVMEKKSEVAILNTQGMTPASVVAVFVVQGASSGIIGSILGGGAGVLIAKNINEIMAFFQLDLLGPGIELPVVVKPDQVLMIVLFAIALSFIATLYPSIKAASVRPAEALRYE